MVCDLRRCEKHARELVLWFWVGMGRFLSFFVVMRDQCGICDGVSA